MGNKKPCFRFGKQGWKVKNVFSRHLPTMSLSGLGLCFSPKDQLWVNTPRPIDRSRRVACATGVSGHLDVAMFIQVRIEREDE